MRASRTLGVAAAIGFGFANGSPALDARAKATCNPGNNCQRGVGGSAGSPPLTSRLADCSSFMLATVTPAVSTTTTTVTVATVTVTVSAIAAPTVVPRQVTVSPSAVPTYATYCSNSAAYSSACSCAGVTPSTTTVPASTTTVTESATATATVTLTPSPCGGTACGSDETCINGVCVPNSAFCASSQPSCPNGINNCNGGACTGDPYACYRRAGIAGDGPGICRASQECVGTTCSSDADCTDSLCVETCCGNFCRGLDSFCSSSSAKARSMLLDRGLFGEKFALPQAYNSTE